MAELYHLFHMLFSALLFLISCLGSLGQSLYQWPNKIEKMTKKELIQSAGDRPVNGAQIEYPADMKAAHKEGRVVLSCDIEINGSTSNCHVVSSSGGISFSKAALKYVNNAHYRPAMKDGIPVKEYGHQYTVNFKLGS